MATTYKDYYIYYNGTYISGNEDTGLTAVNIYYNGSWIGEGAHTLYCGGQYMNGNITIGARTLYCSGQYMNGNVQVTTGARYRWNKYYSPYTYSEAVTKYISGDGATTDDRQIYTPQSAYVYGRGTSYTFDASSGNYTVYNSTRILATSGSFHLDTRPGIYDTGQVYSTDRDSNVSPVMVQCTNGSVYIMQATSSGVFWCALYVGRGSGTAATLGKATIKGATGQYVRGGYIGVVSSTNASAYSYGRNSDGYWYEAI